MSLHKFFQSKVNRLLTALGAISIALGVGAVNVVTKSDSSRDFKAKQSDTQTYSSTVRLYLNADFATAAHASNSSSEWMDMVLSASATDGVAAYFSSKGKYVADLLQATAGGSSSSADSSSLKLYFNEGTTYWHPNDGNNSWNTGTNYLYMAFTPGCCYQIAYTGYSYGNTGDKWFNYSVTTLGQFIHVSYNGGSETDTTVEVDSSTYTLPAAPTDRSGYTFNGWTYNGTTYAAGTAITLVSGVLDVTASWTASTYYTVFFESNGGSSVTAQSIASGSTATKPSDPTKSNYTFVNWYSDSSLTTVYSFSTAVTANLTLYAKWTPATYAISEYEVVNGTANSTKIATEYATYGVNFTPTDIAKSGYSLIGWYTTSACTTAYTATTWTAAGNLYAKYAQQYTVTKKAVVGVNPIDSGIETALYGVAFNPTAPSITGFTVSGWYTNQACTTAYVASATAITSATTLYAKMTASSSFTLVADTATADFPSGYNTDNWSTAKIIYVYCFNASYNSGLVAMTRSTVNGYYTLSISSTWTGVVFCIDSSWQSSSSYWRQSNDVTLTATTGEQAYVITGSTTASSKSGVQKLTTYSNQAASSGRTVYVRNDTALSGSPLRNGLFSLIFVLLFCPASNRPFWCLSKERRARYNEGRIGEHIRTWRMESSMTI
jgi:uncharacterized repeat protein (TIGR02543 family)